MKKNRLFCLFILLVLVGGVSAQLVEKVREFLAEEDTMKTVPVIRTDSDSLNIAKMREELEAARLNEANMRMEMEQMKLRAYAADSVKLALQRLRIDSLRKFTPGVPVVVEGASNIARSLGVSESIIGLTLVAGGTSLPELATSIVAALKKNPEIAIGNVIGSNLFNIFFVLGCSASITPLRLNGITNFDLWVLVGSGILLWLFGLFFAKRTITRIEGGIMILCYIAYTTALIFKL